MLHVEELTEKKNQYCCQATSCQFRVILLEGDFEGWELLKGHSKGGGPGSSVGIATGYGLGGPGIESRCGRDFSHLSIPALRLTHPSVHWVPGL
jgi:hypothetical protein